MPFFSFFYYNDNKAASFRVNRFIDVQLFLSTDRDNNVSFTFTNNRETRENDSLKNIRETRARKISETDIFISMRRTVKFFEIKNFP